MNCECPQCESDNPTATSECSACCKRTCAECAHECGACLDTFCCDCIEECEICGEDACSEHAALCAHCHRTTCMECAKMEPDGTFACIDCLAARRLPNLFADRLSLILADGWQKTALLMLAKDDESLVVTADGRRIAEDGGRLKAFLETAGADDPDTATARFCALWSEGKWGAASAMMEELGVCVQLWDTPLQLNMND